MSRPDSEAVKAKADTLLPPTAPKTELGAKHRLNGFAAGSLVAGLGGLILPFYVSYAFLILAVAAVGLGILALLKLKKRPRQWGRGLAVVGTVMGLVVSILILLILTRPSGE